MKKRRLLAWTGGLAGVPLFAAAYRRLAGRASKPKEERLYVRASVDPALVTDLADLVRSVRGRAAVEGRDALSVPVPSGVSADTAYQELRAVLEAWESRHPGVRAQIVMVGPPGPI
jgi:hypothetical protein